MPVFFYKKNSPPGSVLWQQKWGYDLGVGMCGKPKLNYVVIRFSVCKNRTVQNFDIRSDGFPTETAYNPPFKYKVNKINFTCIKCADKERFKTTATELSM